MWNAAEGNVEIYYFTVNTTLLMQKITSKPFISRGPLVPREYEVLGSNLTAEGDVCEPKVN